jgi:hypothetical protein
MNNLRSTQQIDANYPSSPASVWHICGGLDITQHRVNASSLRMADVRAMRIDSIIRTSVKRRARKDVSRSRANCPILIER